MLVNSSLVNQIEKIDTILLQEFMQSYLAASQEHFDLIKPTLSLSESIRHERMLCQAETLLSVIRCSNLARQHLNYLQIP